MKGSYMEKRCNIESMTQIQFWVGIKPRQASYFPWSLHFSNFAISFQCFPAIAKKMHKNMNSGYSTKLTDGNCIGNQRSRFCFSFFMILFRFMKSSRFLSASLLQGFWVSFHYFRVGPDLFAGEIKNRKAFGGHRKQKKRDYEAFLIRSGF